MYGLYHRFVGSDGWMYKITLDDPPYGLTPSPALYREKEPRYEPGFMYPRPLYWRGWSDGCIQFDRDNGVAFEDDEPEDA